MFPKKKAALAKAGRSLIFLGLCIGFSQLANAHPGNPSTHFGSVGHASVTTIDTVISSSMGNRIVVDRDSRIITSYNTAVSGAALVATDMYGNLDSAFGSGGTLALAGPIEDFKIDSANRIIVLTADSTYDGFNLTRYKSNGDLDSTYGTGGSVDVTASVGTISGYRLQLDPDDNAVVAGSYDPTLEMLAAKVDRDGNLDSTFGVDGIVIVPVMPSDVDTIYPRALGIDNTGAIYLSGYTDNSMSSTFISDNLLIKLTPTGELDTSFAAGTGYVRTNAEPLPGIHDTAANSLTIDSSGNVVIAGSVGSQMFVTRIAPDGAVDSSFNGGNVELLPLGLSLRYAQADTALVDARGRIAITGSAVDTMGSVHLTAARLNPDGSFDTLFGSSGSVILPSEVVNGGEGAFTHDQDLLLYGYAPDGSSVSMDQLVGNDPLKVSPPGGF